MRHGKYPTYAKLGCRCTECRTAMTAYRKQYVEERAAERILIEGRLVHPTATHGKYTTYGNYSCRCEPCTDANTQAINARRAKARANA